jgi:hypothetical protein
MTNVYNPQIDHRLLDRTRTTPDRVIPSACAALVDSSMTRPLPDGPRSLTWHCIEQPACLAVTMLPKGRVRWAQVITPDGRARQNTRQGRFQLLPNGRLKAEQPQGTHICTWQKPVRDGDEIAEKADRHRALPPPCRSVSVSININSRRVDVPAATRRPVTVLHLCTCGQWQQSRTAGTWRIGGRPRRLSDQFFADFPAPCAPRVEIPAKRLKEQNVFRLSGSRARLRLCGRPANRDQKNDSGGDPHTNEPLQR